MRPIGALILLAIVWGGSIPLTKLALRDVPPLTLTALRYLVAAPCFLWVLRGRRLPPPRAGAAAAGLGVLGVAVGQIAQTLGVRLILASVATVVSALIPLFVVALAAVRLHQPMTAAQAAGFAAALGGVALVAGGDPRALAASFTRLDARAAPGAGPSHAGLEGVALVLISAAAVALYYVCSIALIEEYSVPTVAALSSLAGAAVLAPIAAWELGHAPVRLTAVSAGVVLYLALAVTVAGLWVWFGALSRLPAAIPAALQYLQPIVGVLASAALFGDRLDAWFWSGTGLVLAGIGMAARPGMRPSAGARGAAPAEAPGRL